MDRIIVAAFVATFIAAVAAVAGVPAFAQDVPAGAPPLAAPSPEGTPRDPSREEARARFMAMDTDHDGKISKAEWLAAGRQDRGFDFLDADHDGIMTPGELRAGMAKLRAMRDAKGQ